MADIAKNVPVVSNSSSPPVCELTTDSELTFPTQDEGSSLQELIDSELALRISSVASSPEDDEGEDENTKFLLAERTHSFQNYTGNDTFFFSTLEEEELPTRLTLGTFDPFTTTIDTESSPSVECDNGMPVTNHSPLLIPEIDIIPPDDPEEEADDEDGWTTVGEAVAPENYTEQNQETLQNKLMEEIPDENNSGQNSQVYSFEQEGDENLLGHDDSQFNGFNGHSNESSFEQENNRQHSSRDAFFRQDIEAEGTSEGNYNYGVEKDSLLLEQQDDSIPIHKNGFQMHDDINEDLLSPVELDQDPFDGKIEHIILSDEIQEEPAEENSDGKENGTFDSEHDDNLCSSDSDSAPEKRTKKTKTENGMKKSKKTKKSEKENISVKSSFSKFDQLTKKTVLHVRSVDASKVQKQFNQQNGTVTAEQTTNCKSCDKQVFQMEQIKAERAVWHKNCFRCKECSKQLTVDTYSSHEGQLYCKPHFRELFKPKAVVEDEKELPRLRRPKLIVCENQPLELPPEVVRASDKPDLGLEELSQLDVKSRFSVFEKSTENDSEIERSSSCVSVKRSPSILSKLAKFQKKGMDIGVTDEALNGIPFEESSSSSEEEEDDDEQRNGDVNRDVIRANRKQRERPVSFSKMEDIKCKWETGQAARKEELREERKHEISNIRSRLFLGHSGKMKEMYEQAVQDSERSTQRKSVDIKSEKARSIKELFERGEVVPDDEEDGATEDKNKKLKDEDLGVFEDGISKKSRSIFLELDASAAKTQQQAPPITPVKSPGSAHEIKRLPVRQTSQDIVRSSDTVEEVKVATEEVGSKFRFFETYKEPEKPKKHFRITPPREGQVKENSPEREIYRNPEVVRSDDRLPDEEIIRSHTTSKMLSLFRQLEENANKEEVPEGPKPLKRFTPPPDYTKESESSEEESESEEEEEEEEEEDSNPNIIKASDKIEDEFLKQAQSAARAKALRAKFERWEEKENKANTTNTSGHLNGVDVEVNEQASIDTTKSLRARFESLTSESPKPKDTISRPKVNRFVEIQTNQAEYCHSCEKKVYPLEKVETGGKIFHKQCFRCLQCNCILRMETYTLNGGKPYCIPHFKQLFIAKGNYDEGFGLDQHKRKWTLSQEDEVLQNGNHDSS